MGASIWASCETCAWTKYSQGNVPSPDRKPNRTTLIFKLTAKNSKGVESSSQIPVQILKANSRPVANAGPDQIVRENANVTLDGTKSLNPDKERLSFSWLQTFGVRKVVLSGDDTARPTFKAPFVPVNNSLLVFRLTVKDSAGLNSSDLVRISVLKTIGGLQIMPLLRMRDQTRL